MPKEDSEKPKTEGKFKGMFVSLVKGVLLMTTDLKIAAKDTATALETEADGIRRASIKKAEGSRQASILEAEGSRQSRILEAEGKAKAFELVNESFKGNAQVLKKLEVTENSLKNNAKIILTEKGITPQLLIGELPLRAKQ